MSPIQDPIKTHCDYCQAPLRESVIKRHGRFCSANHAAAWWNSKKVWIRKDELEGYLARIKELEEQLGKKEKRQINSVAKREPQNI